METVRKAQGSDQPPRSGQVGFVVDKVALGQFFSEYFGFPCQFSFHRPHHTHQLLSGAGTLVADVPSGLSLTPPQETKKKEGIVAKFKLLCPVLALVRTAYSHVTSA
jgi:hypothetical protein